MSGEGDRADHRVQSLWSCLGASVGFAARKVLGCEQRSEKPGWTGRTTMKGALVSPEVLLAKEGMPLGLRKCHVLWTGVGAGMA
jgi:hypothetical protein